MNTIFDQNGHQKELNNFDYLNHLLIKTNTELRNHFLIKKQFENKINIKETKFENWYNKVMANFMANPNATLWPFGESSK